MDATSSPLTPALFRAYLRLPAQARVASCRPLVTADTITDDQIRLIAGSHCGTTKADRTVRHECRVALGFVAWASKENRRASRSRVAEILNAHSLEVR